MRARQSRLVYIAAWGRSGSTILGNILGAFPGVFDAGELRHFWARAGRADHFCGCGASLARCSFWLRVSSELNDDPDMPTDDFGAVRRWQRESIRTRWTRQLVQAASIAELRSTPLASYLTAFRCLHRAVERTSGADVVVDSSKKTSFGALLRLGSEVPPLVVHLVRDPRAVAFSWQRVRDASPSKGRQMPRHGAASSSVNWVVCNVGGDMLRRRNPDTSLLVRYEDLMSAPRTTISHIVNYLGRTEPGRPFIDEHTVELPPNHAFAGNPSRFRNGRISLSIDDEWVRQQRLTDRLTCDVITLPFLHRYGYRVRAR